MDRWAGVPHIDEARLRARPEVPGQRTETEAQDGAALRSLQDADRLALVARHTDDAVVIYHPDGLIAWVNDAFVRMTGYPASEVVGARRVDLVRGPFTRNPEFAQLGEDLAAGRDVTVEFVTRTKQGASYWVSMQVRAAVQDGEVVGLVGVERDITERRHAEERARRTLRRAESLGIALRYEKRLLNTVLATIPHLVWWKNPDLRYVGANAAYLTFRSLTSLAEVVGRREDQLDVTDGLQEAITCLETAVIGTREPIVDRAVTVTSRRGVRRTYLVSVLPHFEGEEFAGIIGIGSDVSQVADLERRLVEEGHPVPAGEGHPVAAEG